MIPVIIDKDRFKYDIHSLVKAFYPAEEVLVFTSDEWEKRGGFPGGELSFDIKIPDDEPCVKGSELSTNGSLSSCTTPKNLVKQKLYHELTAQTGITLPWGSLTGIRPTRIPMTMLEEGRTTGEIASYLTDVFFVSPEKIKLATDIAIRERNVLGRLTDVGKGYSIYIGIPFCPSRCLYCSFTSYPRSACEDKVGPYLQCLGKEMDAAAELFKGRRLDTIYIGGGTPVALTAGELERLLCMVGDKFDTENLAEFTVEAGRPDAITADRLEVLLRYNVTRISVNPQTMNDETLVRIGRGHTVEDTVRAYELARSMGDFSINMDLILGLPGETEKEVARTMEKVAEMAPDDLTIHSLAVKRGSRLMEMLCTEEEARRKNGNMPGDSTGDKAYPRGGIRNTIRNTDSMMDIAVNSAVSMGLFPYYLYRQKNIAGNFENTGYAAAGKEGLYNILIMEELQDIIALGAGTVSKRVYGDGRIERTDSVRELEQYITRLDEMIERKRKLYK